VSGQLWCTPYLGCAGRQSISTRFNGYLIPCFNIAQPKVQLERAMRKTNGIAIFIGDVIALVGKGAVAVLAVVAGQCEVAQGVQPVLLDTLPVCPQFILPFFRESFVLRQNVLHSVVFYDYALFSAMVFQTT